MSRNPDKVRTLQKPKRQFFVEEYPICSGDIPCEENVNF